MRVQAFDEPVGGRAVVKLDSGGRAVADPRVAWVELHLGLDELAGCAAKSGALLRREHRRDGVAAVGCGMDGHLGRCVPPTSGTNAELEVVAGHRCRPGGCFGRPPAGGPPVRQEGTSTIRSAEPAAPAPTAGGRRPTAAPCARSTPGASRGSTSRPWARSPTTAPACCQLAIRVSRVSTGRPTAALSPTTPMGPLQQPGIVGHGGDELRVGLVTGQPRLGGVPGPQHVSGTHPQQAKDPYQLVDRQRVFGVLAVGELDVVFLEQGDRLATGTSSAGADQLPFRPPVP